MNILHITDGIPPLVLGGSGRIAWDTATALVRNGHTVSMLTSAVEGILPQEKEEVRILSIPPRSQRWAHYRSVFSHARAEEVMTYIRDIKPDIIHAHVIAGQCGYLWIPKTRALGIPVIITCHDVMNVALGRVLPDDRHIWLKDLRRLRWSWNPFRTAIVRRILQKNCKILTVSDALKEYMELFGYRNLRTLRNGVDLSFWKEEDRTAARDSLHIPQSVTVFLLAGRLGIDKGTEEMARFLKALISSLRATPTCAHSKPSKTASTFSPDNLPNKCACSMLSVMQSLSLRAVSIASQRSYSKQWLAVALSLRPVGVVQKRRSSTTKPVG